jgi:GTP-binding protein EngB required for normal cell division
MPDRTSNSLNPNHVRRLSVTCRYIDKLLAEMESALNVPASKVAFPQYTLDISPSQRRVIEDYIGRIRAQLIRVLDGQGVERPPADIPVSRSLHSHLTFVDIAAEELKPEYMRGYGEVLPEATVELNGISGEVQSLVRQLDEYLMRASSENLQERLERLEQTGDEVLLLKKLESIIGEYGLVEFRSTLSMILDRLEDNRFEIAIFGRVSCGKSSLLNNILGINVLPVGVTPITSVPTRLLYADSPKVDVWFASRAPERFEISRLPEFVAEQFNPANEKHVTRILVQLPSPRLRDGITFVDTPGLGSLATRGSAETLAYLPRCDLGVVMIDAGSTLTPDDLQTIQILYEAAIPATVLLSKADLLTPQDHTRIIEYVKDHIKRELHLDLAVHPVSVVPGSQDLLTHWFEKDIAPLYGQRQELKIQSIRRKLGALRQSVEMALRSRLRQKEHISPKKIEQLRAVEAELRQGNGRLEEIRKISRRVTDELEFSSRKILWGTAAALLEAWSRPGTGLEVAPGIVLQIISSMVQEQTGDLHRRIEALGKKLPEILQATAEALELEDIPAEQEFVSAIREMPAFDLGQLDVSLKRPLFLGILGERIYRSIVAKRLEQALGRQLKKSLSAYHALLYDWADKALGLVQRRFDAYANRYRAQVERLVGNRLVENEEIVRRDLEKLHSAPPEQVGTR